MAAYALAISNGVAGQIANQDPHSVHSGVAEVAMPFGVAVIVGAADSTLNTPAASTATVAGVSVSTYANANAGFALGIQPQDAVSVLTNGTIYVISETAVTANGATPSPVYVRYTINGGLNQLGSFRTDADTSRALLLSQAKWLTSCAAGGLAQLQINLP